MTAHDPSLHRKPGGLLGWLGLGKGDPSDGSSPGALAHPDQRSTLNRQQVEDVVRFLAAHQLDVNSASLAAGWSYLAGADRDLVRAIDRRIMAREPLTQEWLEAQLGAGTTDQDLATLADLMARLETSIEEFGKTSHDAHRATSDYHSALEGHVGELEQVTRAGDVISDLANIAKVMLKRTREIEKQMLRSEAQTRALRRRLDEARRSAEEDHLTGLPNRRAFEARFAEEYRDARAVTDRLCVAFCDIDHFKRINDEHGHDAGDRVLKLVADSLASLSGDNCHVARHGGEEFVVLLRGDSVDEAAARLEVLRAALADRRLVNRANDRPFGQITFSAGLADVFACGNPRSALKAADSALYRAKLGGRNKLEIAGPEDSHPAQLTAA